MNQLKALIDGMSAQWMRERAKTQMTLGKLIAALEKLPSDAQIQGMDSPHSYRGYYSDLAFEERSAPISSADLLGLCRGAMGNVYEGYKGGEYPMHANTPVWLASWGCCGKKIMDINPDGTLELADDEY